MSVLFLDIRDGLGTALHNDLILVHEHIDDYSLQPALEITIEGKVPFEFESLCSD